MRMFNEAADRAEARRAEATRRWFDAGRRADMVHGTADAAAAKVAEWVAFARRRGAEDAAFRFATEGR